jgi:Protein of unknown function (DUF2844)
MKLKYHFGIIALVFLLTQSFAWAKLGDKTADTMNDKSVINAKSVTTNDTSACYKVVNMDSDGQHIKEFVNKSSDTVFMVATVGRLRTPNRQLMSESDFKEFQSSVRPIKRTVSHRSHDIVVETANLKVRTSRANMIYRSVLIKKNATPSCVSNAESLL